MKKLLAIIAALSLLIGFSVVAEEVEDNVAVTVEKLPAIVFEIVQDTISYSIVPGDTTDHSQDLVGTITYQAAGGQCQIRASGYGVSNSPEWTDILALTNTVLVVNGTGATNPSGPGWLGGTTWTSYHLDTLQPSSTVGALIFDTISQVTDSQGNMKFSINASEFNGLGLGVGTYTGNLCFLAYTI